MLLGDLCHQARYNVRVDVRAGTTVFEVTLAVEISRHRDSDRSATVGHTVLELPEGRGFVCAREALLEARTVVLEVQRNTLRLTELLAVLVNDLQSAIFTQRLAGSW